MKKIVALGAIAALFSGMIFADEPAINTSIADFTGNDVSNLVIEDTTFTEGTTIKFIGKNAKKCFKDTKKAFKKLYKIEFVKEIK